MTYVDDELNRLLDNLVISDTGVRENETAVEKATEAELLFSKTSRTPEKHYAAKLKNARHPAVRLWAELFAKKAEERKIRARAKENEQRRNVRAAKSEKRRRDQAATKKSPEYVIEVEAGRRFKLLTLAVKYRRGDKLVEQLAGRETELTLFWRAMCLAALQTPGRAPSDQEVADKFSVLAGKNYTRHQARTRRGIVGKLEQRAGVWLEASKATSAAGNCPEPAAIPSSPR